jgi:hypothetical protein
MSRLYSFAARFSGCMAGLCAVLAVLAVPSSARADDPTCQSCCYNIDPSMGYMYNQCMSECALGQGPCGIFGCNSFCAIVCGPYNGGPTSGIPCTGNCTGTGCHFGCGCSFINGCNECG